MKKWLALFLLVLTAAPVWAAPGNPGNLVGVLLLVLLYGILSASCIGWALLAVVVWRPRVQKAGRLLNQRPGASFFMGLLSLGWWLLSIAVAERIKVFGLVVVLTSVLLIGLVMAGLPALLVQLGRGLMHLEERNFGPVMQVILGGCLLFLAGGLPWLGWLLLLGSGLTAAGSSLLSYFIPEPGEAPADDNPRATSPLQSVQD